MNSILDIKHAYYINLSTRPDRKKHVEEQLKTIGIHMERFNAIKMKNGAIGCSMSHLKLLETAKTNNFDHILIVEDDILFTQPETFVNQFNKFLSRHGGTFDVVLIAGNNMPPYVTIDDSCVKVSQCQTTTGYLVRKHYYDKLINNYKEGILKLMKEQHNHRFYAIDKHWFSLQATDNWYLITPLTVTQKDGYSDIEQRPTHYSHVMLDLDKTAFIQRQKDLEYIRQLSKIKIKN
jgi:glycosyl transferase family 25